jgi:outer membrane autotransporter protein
MKKVPVQTGPASRDIFQGTLTLALLGATLTAAPPARADDECGPAAGETLVTCTAAGGPYQTITYNTNTGLTLHLEGGVEAEDLSGAHDTVQLVGSGSGLLRVEVAEGATVAGAGAYMQGVSVAATSGSASDIEIDIAGDLFFDTQKAASDRVVSAGASAFTADVTNTGNITIVQRASSQIRVNGYDSGGLSAVNQGSGNTTVITAGRIVVTNSEEAAGADAWGYPDSTGDILVEQLAGGSIDTTGYKSDGLAAGTLGSGAVSVRSAGSLATHGDESHGLHAWMLAPDTIGQASVQLLAGGDVLTEGTGSHGMYVQNPGLGGSVAQSAGAIRTQGDFSHGLSLQVDANNAAVMQAELSGDAVVETAGSNSYGVHLAHAGTGAANVSLLDSARIQTTGDQAHGVNVTSGSGGATFLQQSGSSITTAGEVATGIEVHSAADVQARLAGAVSTSGNGSYAVALNSTAGTVNADLLATSRINTTGDNATGLAITTPGDVSLTQAAGAELASHGEQAMGIAVWADNEVVLELGGAVAAEGNLVHGVLATSTSGGVQVTLGAGADVSVSGSDAKALVIASQLDATANLGGRVSSHGDYSAGVYVGSAAGSALATMASGTAISAAGEGSIGMELSAQDDVTLHAAGTISAEGDYSNALMLFSSAGGAVLTMDAGSTISASGEVAYALSVETELDARLSLNGTLLADGRGAAAVVARSQAGGINLDIGAGTSISGGWASPAGSAVGLALSSATGSTVFNAGSIGSASDLAVLVDDGNLAFANAGELTGFVQFANAAGNRLDNEAGGIVTLRHFADTDGDGQRDTRRVAISDFSSGNAVFANQGLLRLGTTASATSIDASGYHVPTTGIANVALSGPYSASRVAQAQLVNLGSFEHSGIIDLRGAAIGNSLVITSNAAAGGAAGTGTFVSNGGELHLNAAFDSNVTGGGYADMLVVDRTALGTAPTFIHLYMDPATIGAATQGNGIQLVEVRDKSASADGVFALSRNMSSGLYEYSLRHNGVGADAADGNWYVRNTIADPANPGQEYPAYRDPIPAMVVVQSQAARIGLGTLGTYHDRVGQHYADRKAQGGNERRAAWGRWFGYSNDLSRGGDTMAEQDAQFREHGPSYDNELMGAQVGHDLFAHTSGSGATQVVGFHVGYAEAHSRVSAVYGGVSGTSRLDSVAGGLYWTYRASGGAYLDALLQAADYDAEATLQGQALRIEADGRGYSASLEGGAPLPLRNGWLVEPQAQLVYQKIHFDDTREQFAQVAHVGARALNGRLGARIARNWVSPAGQARSAWLRAQAWDDFGRQSTSRVSSVGTGGADAVDVHTDLGGTRGQLQLALSGELDRNFTAFASADYDFALDGRRGNGYGWRFGISRMW